MNQTTNTDAVTILRDALTAILDLPLDWDDNFPLDNRNSYSTFRGAICDLRDKLSDEVGIAPPHPHPEGWKDSFYVHRSGKAPEIFLIGTSGHEVQLYENEFTHLLLLMTAAAPTAQNTERAAIQPAGEAEKALADALYYGTGLTIGGKHVPYAEYAVTATAPSSGTIAPDAAAQGSVDGSGLLPLPDDYYEVGDPHYVRAYGCDQMYAYARAHIAQRAAVAEVASRDDAVRKFLTDCAATSGGMVNGNHLARYAKKLLDATPTASTPPAPAEKTACRHGTSFRYRCDECDEEDFPAPAENGGADCHPSCGHIGAECDYPTCKSEAEQQAIAAQVHAEIYGAPAEKGETPNYNTPITYDWTPEGMELVFGGQYMSADAAAAPSEPVAASPLMQVAPSGWKLVPVDPTQAMLDAAIARGKTAGKYEYYVAMLAAAPVPPVALVAPEQAKSPDANVEKNRELLLQRSVVGLDKYGVTTVDSPISHRDWLQHALLEALDMANYLQAAINRPEVAPEQASVRDAALEEAAKQGLTPERIDWLANCACPGGAAYPHNVKVAIIAALHEVATVIASIPCELPLMDDRPMDEHEATMYSMGHQGAMDAIRALIQKA